MDKGAIAARKRTHQGKLTRDSNGRGLGLAPPGRACIGAGSANRLRGRLQDIFVLAMCSRRGHEMLKMGTICLAVAAYPSGGLVDDRLKSLV